MKKFAALFCLAVALSASAGAAGLCLATAVPRNIAFRRSVLQSSVADFTHVGHLVTDGLRSGTPLLTTETRVELPGKSPDNEQAKCATDGRKDTKWVVFAPSCWVEVVLPSPAKATSYSVTTANDESRRDPKVWRVLGSVDGKDYVELARMDDPQFHRRHERKTWKIDHPGSYRFYRFAIDSNGGGVAQDRTTPCTQIAEFDVLDADGKSLVRSGNEKGFASRWVSKTGRDEWLKVDLGAPSRVDAVKVDWTKGGEMPDWAFGPFVRPNGVNPVISPNKKTVFDCPMRKRPIKWEESDTFNPAAAVKDGKIVVLYRAEDNTAQGIGSRTSRLGYAETTDGVTMKRDPVPVMFPCEDDQKEFDWEGGCEDPRVAMTEGGLYVCTYTSWNRKLPRLCVATSRDLRHWKKHGPAFARLEGERGLARGSKSAAILQRQDPNDPSRWVIAKVGGKYIMYWGEGAVNVATSENLVDWRHEGMVMAPRAGFFDSALTEVGPAALLTKKGIVVFYNGKNATDGRADQKYPRGVYCGGQALFDRTNPKKFIERLDVPYFKPESDFEKTGQYRDGTVFTEGLVFFKGKWHLYYGCADSFVGYAVWDPAK